MAEPKGGGGQALLPPWAQAPGSAPATAWPELKVQIPVLPALAPDIAGGGDDDGDDVETEWCDDCKLYHVVARTKKNK